MLMYKKFKSFGQYDNFSDFDDNCEKVFSFDYVNLKPSNTN